MSIIIPRTKWPKHFADVIVHGNLAARNRHPYYRSAKTGDAEAAVKFVRDFLEETALQRIKRLLGDRKPFVMPVTAIETMGFNAIPDAMMQAIADRLDLVPLPGVIVQSNLVAHTGAGGWHRLVTPAVFSGKIVPNGAYLLVDDHVGFGGTLANLRGHIETNGGHVIGMTALTETGGGNQIAIRAETHSVLQSKHGNGLDQLWHERFGYGAECFTDIEGSYLARVKSIDDIKNRMAEAAEHARSQGLSAIDV